MNERVRPEFGTVQWTDLLPLTRREVANELTLSLPWLVGSIYCYQAGMIVSGLGCSFFFFLTGLRQSHGAQHYSLGISRGAHEWTMFGLSLLMMSSMHAVQVSHLNHHRHCLEAKDHEGSAAKGRWWEALLGGPLFVMTFHREAWRLGTAKSRRWILAELICVMLLASYTASQWAATGVACHISVMMVGECFTGFFAVWTVHHDCEDKSGRTQRGEWLNRISYNMFFHREHHLWPAVPTAHLDELAQRLDQRDGPARNLVLTYDARSKIMLDYQSLPARRKGIPCRTWSQLSSTKRW